MQWREDPMHGTAVVQGDPMRLGYTVRGGITDQ
jgi:hypothetical protein